MDPISVRDVKADGNARIHVGNSSITHVHNYAEPQGILLFAVVRLSCANSRRAS